MRRVGIRVAIIGLLALALLAWAVPIGAGQGFALRFPSSPGGQAADDEVVVIAVEPPYSVVSLGEKFTLTIMIRAGQRHVDAAQVYLGFDPQYLEVLSIAHGALPILFQASVDSEAGYITYIAGAYWNSEAPSGTFDLMTLELKAIGLTVGTPLTFSKTPPRVTYMTYGGEKLPMEVVNGRVIVAMPTPGITPTRTYLYLPLVLREYTRR